MNTWTFNGEIFYLKELEGEFAASLKLRGTYQRKNAISVQVAEVSCLMQKETYDRFKHSGYRTYDTITLSGHIESWVTKNSTKLMLIAEDILV